MYDVSITCDFAEVMKHMITQTDVNVTGFLSYDLKATTETTKASDSVGVTSARGSMFFVKIYREPGSPRAQS